MSPLVNPIPSHKKNRTGLRAPLFRGRLLSFGTSVTPQVLADFFDQLGTLLVSGIPLLKALEFARAATKHKRLSQAIQDIAQKVRAGARLSEGLAGFPEIFDHVVLGMIRAAEASGHLETVCKELERSFTQRAETRSRIVQALAYPGLVATVGLLTVCVLLVFVVPKLSGVFELWDTPLPLVTRVLLSMAHFMRAGGFMVLIFLTLGFLFLIRFIGPAKRRQIGFAVAVRTPFVKDLFFLRDFVHLTRTWGMLLRSGVPLMTAIKSSKDVLWNFETRLAMNTLQEKMLRGGRLEEEIRGAKWFPELAQSYLEVGSQTGTLDQSFEKIAAFYERELDRKIKLMGIFLEPLLILAIGLVVGFLVISLLLPIFEISTVVR